MSRTVTLAGYAVLAAALAATQVAALLSRRRLPSLGRALAPLTGSAWGRAALLAGWAWLGWHLFVRTA